MNRHIAYYLSAHGYGHGVRGADVIRAINRLAPDVWVTIVSDLPEAFLRNRLPAGRNEYRRGSFDVGMVQLDSIRVDVPATLAAVGRLYSRRAELVEQESRFLRESGAGLVVCDLPAIPLEAAKRAGLPSAAVGNFSWDWIYGEFAEKDVRWRPFVAAIEEGFAQCDLLLRAPFHDEMAAFPRKEDIPLLATPGTARRGELATVTGADPAKPWTLISFTTLGWDDAALDRVEGLEGHDFFTVQPLGWKRRNIHAVDRGRMPFSDVLASADTVISKPGFGLVSECVVNRKPLLYADRSDFREYAVLVDGIRRCLRCLHIPGKDLYGGNLGPYLDALRRAPEPPETISAGGDVIAARRMLEMLAG